MSTQIVFLKEFFKKVDFEKKSADDKKARKISQGAGFIPNISSVGSFFSLPGKM